jgi:hypothetical protein
MKPGTRELIQTLFFSLVLLLVSLPLAGVAAAVICPPVPVPPGEVVSPLATDADGNFLSFPDLPVPDGEVVSPLALDASGNVMDITIELPVPAGEVVSPLALSEMGDVLDITVEPPVPPGEVVSPLFLDEMGAIFCEIPDVPGLGRMGLVALIGSLLLAAGIFVYGNRRFGPDPGWS